MSDAAGGRTRVTGLITAAAVAAVLLFFTAPLQYVPIAALGAVLVKAAFSLLDLKALKTFYRMDRRELALSLLATLGVAAVGAVQAILVVTILALLRFVRLASRPKVEILGTVPGMPGLHSIDRHPTAETIPGLLLFRFNGPIVFFNSPFFKRSVLRAIEGAPPGVEWFVLDSIPITMLDLTGLQVTAELIDTLRAKGIQFVAAGRETEWKQWLQSKGFRPGYCSFPTLRSAIRAFRDNKSSAEAPSDAPSLASPA